MYKELCPLPKDKREKKKQLSGYKQSYTCNNQSLEVLKYMNLALVMCDKLNPRGKPHPPHFSKVVYARVRMFKFVPICLWSRARIRFITVIYYLLLLRSILIFLAPSQPPVNVVVSAIYSQQVEVVWEPPSVDEQNGIIRR